MKGQMKEYILTWSLSPLLWHGSGGLEPTPVREWFCLLKIRDFPHYAVDR